MTWQIDNAISWFKRLVRAFWDATAYKWDDLNCTWDAISSDDIWETDSAQPWANKTKTDWKTKNTGSWFSKQ